MYSGAWKFVNHFYIHIYIYIFTYFCINMNYSHHFVMFVNVWPKRKIHPVPSAGNRRVSSMENILDLTLSRLSKGKRVREREVEVKGGGPIWKAIVFLNSSATPKQLLVKSLPNQPQIGFLISSYGHTQSLLKNEKQKEKKKNEMQKHRCRHKLPLNIELEHCCIIPF